MNYLIPHPGLPIGLKRFDLIKLIEPLLKRLGLNSDDLRYLQYHISRTLVSDFNPGRICMTWVAVDKIAADLSMSLRKINRIENKLEGLGFIRRVLSAHKRRFGLRDDAKQIVSACGIDLGPFITRAPQLKNMLAETQKEFADLCSLKTECNDLLKRIRAYDCDSALVAAKKLLPRLRPSEVKCPRILQDICDGIGAIISKWDARLRQTDPAAEQDKNDRRIIDQEHISLSCSRPAKTEQQDRKPSSATPSQIRSLVSLDLKDAIDLYASGQGEHHSTPSWKCLMLAARDIGTISGISHQVWESACAKLGEEYAVLAFAIVHKNSERIGTRWHVDNIPAAFTGLSQKAVKDPSCIDRIWAGLVHECGGSL